METGKIDVMARDREGKTAIELVDPKYSYVVKVLINENADYEPFKNSLTC